MDQSTIPPDGKRSSSNVSKTLLKGLRVMECFDVGHRELSLTELVHVSGLEISGARRLLSTLVGAGYLTQDQKTRRYRLSSKVLGWSVAYLGNDPLVTCAFPILQNVSDESGFQLELSVLNGSDCVVLVSMAGAEKRLSLIKGPSVGVREPAFCSPTGLAILAFMPQRSAYELIDAGPREPITDHTIVETDAIMEALVKTREHGYSLTDRACHPRAIAIGAPVFDYAGQPIAALALTVDIDDYTVSRARRELTSIVLKTAQTVSLAYQRSI
ncbi:MAG: IclR family transcriptional regulator [Pseudomonadota bacterium]